MSRLSINLSKLKLRNPTILASGILGSYSASLLKVSEYAGAVVTKSVGEYREGNKNPTVVNSKCNIVNAVGLPSNGPKKFYEELKELKTLSNKVPLIVSLFGRDEKGFSSLVEYFPDASAFELNLSCPHAEGLGMEVGIYPEKVKAIVEAVKCETDKPIFVKLTPNVTNIVEIGKAAEKGGADAVVAINTVKGIAIDITSKKPILSNKLGGVSGKAIKPIALRCVWDLYKEITIPIVGCGGITTWSDALEFILAGATAVEIGSAFFYSYRIIESIVKGLDEYLYLNNENIRNLVGVAHVL